MAFTRLAAGSPIKAETINNIASGLESARESSAGQTTRRFDWKKGIVYFLVDTQVNLPAFSNVVVAGFAYSPFGEDRKCLRDGIVLSAWHSYVDSQHFQSLDTFDQAGHGVLLEMATPRGNIVKGLVPGLVLGYVKPQDGWSQTRRRCEPVRQWGGYTETNMGSWKIIARHPVREDELEPWERACKVGDFCALVPDDGGHLVGEMAQHFFGSERIGFVLVKDETITLDEPVEVGCPLLREDQVIPAGTKVVLSRNRGTGVWEIINAGCD